MTAAWVVGAGGLLGRALVSAVERRQGWNTDRRAPLPWADDSGFPDSVRAGIRDLLTARTDGAEAWTILWAAGAAVTSTPQDQLDRELGQFRNFLTIVGEEAEAAGASDAGAVFYASSAGGVYSGSANPPFDETSAVAPISPYGRFKLAAEAELADFSSTWGIRSVAGRIANLYGPGQQLQKMQGIISHLALAQLTPRPVSIYVSLDTLRDYIFVDDCAELILDVVDRAMETPRGHAIKNLSSGRAVTIADLIGQFRIVLKRTPKVLLGTSAAAALQARDLRIRSVVWTDLDRRAMTPLAVGIHATLDDIMHAVQQGMPTGRPAAGSDRGRNRS